MILSQTLILTECQRPKDKTMIIKGIFSKKIKNYRRISNRIKK